MAVSLPSVQVIEGFGEGGNVARQDLLSALYRVMLLCCIRRRGQEDAPTVLKGTGLFDDCRRRRRAGKTR